MWPYLNAPLTSYSKMLREKSKPVSYSSGCGWKENDTEKDCRKKGKVNIEKKTKY